MIAQLVAIEHPERTRSLVSIMSATGEPDYGQSSDEAMAALMSPAPPTEAEFVAQQVTSSRVWSSPRHFDPEAAATLAEASFRHGIVPGGTAPQLAAMPATGATLAVPR